jgi:hypothetical protein
MSDTKPPKGRLRTLTVAALLGIFIGAVLLALAGKLVPGKLARLLGKHDETDRS